MLVFITVHYQRSNIRSLVAVHQQQLLSQTQRPKAWRVNCFPVITTAAAQLAQTGVYCVILWIVWCVWPATGRAHHATCPSPSSPGPVAMLAAAARSMGVDDWQGWQRSCSIIRRHCSSFPCCGKLASSMDPIDEGNSGGDRRTRSFWAALSNLLHGVKV